LNTDHGICTSNTKVPGMHICSCDTYYDLFTNCSTNIFETYNRPSLIAYPVLGIILLSMIFCLYFWAILTDIRFGSLSTLKRIGTVIKLVVVGYAFIRLLSFGFYVQEL